MVDAACSVEKRKKLLYKVVERSGEQWTGSAAWKVSRWKGQREADFVAVPVLVLGLFWVEEVGGGDVRLGGSCICLVYYPSSTRGTSSGLALFCNAAQWVDQKWVLLLSVLLCSAGMDGVTETENQIERAVRMSGK